MSENFHLFRYKCEVFKKTEYRALAEEAVFYQKLYARPKEREWWSGVAGGEYHVNSSSYHRTSEGLYMLTLLETRVCHHWYSRLISVLFDQRGQGPWLAWVPNPIAWQSANSGGPPKHLNKITNF